MAAHDALDTILDAERHEAALERAAHQDDRDPDAPDRHGRYCACPDCDPRSLR